jgi:aminopeptidase
MDPRVKKHAEVLMKYSLDLKKGDKLIIQGEHFTMPLIKECFRLALELGAHPQVKITSSELSEIMMKQGSDQQLTFIHESDRVAIQTADALLTLMGSVNTRMMSNVDPDRLRVASQGNAEIFKIFFERMASNELRWCGTMFPGQSNAQEASMSLSEYEDFVYNSCYLNLDDPVAKWREIEREQKKICDILDTKKELQIISKDTDLRMSIAGRRWVNCCGQVNFPDGEVFTGPVEDSVNGHIRFSFPGIYSGREVENIQLTFQNGKVAKATADKGEDLLNKLLDTDAGARLVGEIAVGTNYNITKFTKNMLFDEKIGGTVHLAIGRSIPESLGVNQSAIHWDMLCDMQQGGRILADGKVIYQNGKFTI